jgi:hypothetical protein
MDRVPSCPIGYLRTLALSWSWANQKKTGNKNYSVRPTLAKNMNLKGSN